jgi:hypothetical protein
MKFIKRALYSGLLGIGLLSQNVFAGDCVGLLSQLVSHSAAQENFLNFVFVGAQEGAKWGVFTEGRLDVSGYMSLGGQGTSYASARRWYPPRNPASPTGFVGPGFPFSPYKTEQVRLDITRDFLGSNRVYIVVTLLNWGNSQYTSFPSCDNGMMHGVIGGSAYAISFGKVFQTAVR